MNQQQRQETLQAYRKYHLEKKGHMTEVYTSLTETRCPICKNQAKYVKPGIMLQRIGRGDWRPTSVKSWMSKPNMKVDHLIVDLVALTELLKLSRALRKTAKAAKCQACAGNRVIHIDICRRTQDSLQYVLEGIAAVTETLHGLMDDGNSYVPDARAIIKLFD